MKPEMDKVIEFFRGELAGLRTGRANPALVTELPVDVYGTATPLKQLAQVGTPDATSIIITPWDKSALGPIEEAVGKANLGASPINDGTVIRIALPPLTEERRHDMTKVVAEKLEAARVAVRNLRHEAIKAKEQADLPEDALKGEKNKLTEEANKFNAELDRLAEEKKQEIMTV